MQRAGRLAAAVSEIEGCSVARHMARRPQRAAALHDACVADLTTGAAAAILALSDLFAAAPLTSHGV